jgi:hypothetical protein
LPVLSRIQIFIQHKKKDVFLFEVVPTKIISIGQQPQEGPAKEKLSMRVSNVPILEERQPHKIAFDKTD